MNGFLGLAAFAGGFAACWFGKDWIKEKISGVEAFAQSLEDKAKALRDKVKAVI